METTVTTTSTTVPPILVAMEPRVLTDSTHTRVDVRTRGQEPTVIRQVSRKIKRPLKNCVKVLSFLKYVLLLYDSKCKIQVEFSHGDLIRT